jgi:hypothetical protein
VEQVLASEIAAIERALRATLEDIAAGAALSADGVPLERVIDAWNLVDHLSIAVDRLEDDEEAESARRRATYLAAQVARLERRLMDTVHH